MGRDFQINGPCMVSVKGAGALFDNENSSVVRQLGLAAGPVTVVPRFYHKDIHVDDFGPDVPAEIMNQLADVNISMVLTHYDTDVLSRCIRESMAGAANEGTLAPGGTLMGNGIQLFVSGCHFISLNLASPSLNEPWRFRATYLAERPVEIPLGTEKSLTTCNWRAIPYYMTTVNGSPPRFVSSGEAFREISSSGVVLWDRTADSDPENVLGG